MTHDTHYKFVIMKPNNSMKSKTKTTVRKKASPKLILKAIDPRFITFTSKYDPVINRHVKRIMGLS